MSCPTDISGKWWVGLLFLETLFHLCTPTVLADDGPDPGPPAWVEVEPNAIQDARRPMVITVGGIPQGERVLLQVFQDCDSDGEPDLYSRKDCRNPLFERPSEPANAQNIVLDRLDFTTPTAQNILLQTEKPLWLRASRPGSRYGQQVLFGVVEDDKVCSLWQSVVDTFFGGYCDPHLVQALRQHRAPSDLEDGLFEVRLLEFETGNAGDVGDPISVPGTRGATGVAWLDADTLVVTLAGAANSGLYRISLEDGVREPLWSPPPGDPCRITAPRPLSDDRIAIVRQHLGEPLPGEPGAYLSLWQDGWLTETVPLPYKIHQLVGHDVHGEAILALTLGIAHSRPGFLGIDLSTRQVRLLGYHHGLYHAAMRAPGGNVSVISTEDTTEQMGWFLFLADGKGQWFQDLQIRPQHDLLPAWRPDGRGIAYLAQVSEAEP